MRYFVIIIILSARNNLIFKWILAFIRFSGKRHPKELGRTEIEGFLSDMAVNKNYAASTQSLALNAVVFLYKQVLDFPIADDLKPIRSKKVVRLTVVLSQSEVTQVLAAMSVVAGLRAKLMYGGGLRVMEMLRLRVQDIDFANGYLIVRDGKGGKDRATLLGNSVVNELQAHLLVTKALFEQDRLDHVAGVYLPNALDKSIPMPV